MNYDDIPNAFPNLDETSIMAQAEGFDPGNKYCVPYCWGTVGILYNKTMVDEPIDQLGRTLGREVYKDNILMQDSVRDAFAGCTEIKAGLLSCILHRSKHELEEAKKPALIDQKPLVQAYVIDQVRDKMIGNEAAHRCHLLR